MHQCINVNASTHYPAGIGTQDNARMNTKPASTIADVLAKLMADHEIPSANALGRRTGLPQPTISRILNGSTKDPEAATVRILADFFSVTESQMRGIDAITPAVNERIGRYNVEPGPDIAGQLPLISWVQAGAWQTVSDPYSPGVADEWLSCPVKHSPRSFVLRVRGESMFNPYERPSFSEGDLIFVDPERAAVHGSLVVVRMEDSQEATFKKLVIEGDSRYLKALNPAWPEKMIPINGNATICGVVIFKGERL